MIPGGAHRDNKTKICCDFLRKTQGTSGAFSFDSVNHDCRGSGPRANGLDSGSFASCCSKNNSGSVGE